jgi:lysophospholipase L1-like esterase
MLKKMFPETKFKFTVAGIASTGSATGAFRLKNDVLSKGPVDLLFVEFTVNDDQDGAEYRNKGTRGLEGILVQTLKHNPYADIVITEFVNEYILASLMEGKPHSTHDAHVALAKHYNLSNNDLAKELAEQIKTKKVTWEMYGGVHPKKFGNTMCATMIENGFKEAWKSPLPTNYELKPYTEKKLVDEFSYVRGHYVSIDDIEMDKTWQVGVPNWKKIKGGVRPYFRNKKMISSSTVGGKLKISFSGTAIGAYILSGPDTAVLQCSIDGGRKVIIDPIHKHSRFQYPETVMFFDDLENGKHTLELEIIENRPGRKRPGGTAFRALHFVAN